MSKLLLLDAGNTRLKWAVVEGGLWREQGGAAYADLSALAPVLEAGIDCYIASVARGSMRSDQRAADAIRDHPPKVDR